MLGHDHQRSPDHAGTNTLIPAVGIDLNVVDTKFLPSIPTTAHQADTDNLAAFCLAHDGGALKGKRIVPEVCRDLFSPPSQSPDA